MRATLRGTVQPGTRIDRALLVERCGEHLGALELEDRTVVADYAAIAREPTVRGRAVAELLERAAGGDDDAQRALRIRGHGVRRRRDRAVKLRRLTVAGFGALGRPHVRVSATG